MNVVTHPKVAVLRLAFPVLVSFVFLLSQNSPAQEQPNFQQPSAVNPVQWVSGPATANFGEIAQINIPDGYQFLDKKSAGFFLQGMHNPVPDNLLGVLAPISAKWFAVIEFSGMGYVSDADAGQLSADAMLSKVRSLIARQNVSISSADWEIKPSYDPAQNKLEWAIRVLPQGDVATVNYSVRLLGRRGVMEVIAVQPQSDFDPAPLREMVKGISFKDGERYTDFKTGDKLAKASIAQLAAYENGPDSASSKPGHKMLWIALGLGVLLLVGVGLITTKLVRAVRSAAAQKQLVAPAMAVESASAAYAAPIASAAPVASSSITRAKNPAPASPRPMMERNGRPSKFHGRKRKRQYNFHLFYSDMIMNLTRWNYVGGFGTYASDYAHGITNGATPEQGAENGNGSSAGNGASANGNHAPAANGNHNASVTNGTPSPDAAKTLALETSKLIESQQKLIEGQRRLIEEQNKLIQEKSKLIDFESNVLGKQSELIGEQELL